MKKVVWTKWVDPMNTNLDEVEWPGFDAVDENAIRQMEFYDFEDGTPAVAEQDIDYDGLTKEIHAIKPVRIINTKLGLLTVTEHTLAANQFDFWNIHTNFDITDDVLTKLRTAEGVETLQIISRYRARIGFPRVETFDVSVCKSKISSMLCREVEEQDVLSSLPDDDLFPEEVQREVSALLDNIKKNKYWFVYVAPNGHIDSVAASSKNEIFLSKKSLFQRVYQAVGGSIYGV